MVPRSFPNVEPIREYMALAESSVTILQSVPSSGSYVILLFAMISISVRSVLGRLNTDVESSSLDRGMNVCLWFCSLVL
jgi:hypothetical protein